MTNAQKAALKHLERIMRIDPAQTPYRIRSAADNLLVDYTTPVTATVVIFPSGSLYFVGEPDDRDT